MFFSVCLTAFRINVTTDIQLKQYSTRVKIIDTFFGASIKLQLLGFDEVTNTKMMMGQDDDGAGRMMGQDDFNDGAGRSVNYIFSVHIM